MLGSLLALQEEFAWSLQEEFLLSQLQMWLWLLLVSTAPSQTCPRGLGDEELHVTVWVSPHLSSNLFTGYQ